MTLFCLSLEWLGEGEVSFHCAQHNQLIRRFKKGRKRRKEQKVVYDDKIMLYNWYFHASHSLSLAEKCTHPESGFVCQVKGSHFNVHFKLMNWNGLNSNPGWGRDYNLLWTLKYIYIVDSDAVTVTLTAVVTKTWFLYLNLQNANDSVDTVLFLTAKFILGDKFNMDTEKFPEEGNKWKHTPKLFWFSR